MSSRSTPPGGDATVNAETCVSLGAAQAQLDAYPTRDIALGHLQVQRALPVKGRRLIGPWCFLDRFGPLSFTEGLPMDVAAHPHIGLQTVSWLLDGEIAHTDSLGSDAVLRPGGVNVMTSGRAIAHAEQTPRDHTGRLNGVQLWTALPDAVRHGAPDFQHVAEVPRLELRGGLVQVFSGAVADARSSATHFSPIVGADVRVHRGGSLTVPIEPSHEHGLLVLDGDVALEGQPLEPRVLYYTGTARHALELASRDGARVLLVGGAPFPETILMWWNFVARTPEEIRDARTDWETHQRFGEVRHYSGPRLSAPELLHLARPNPLS
jgi:redox-sensitive bicupin YhaK (pirin superfamily)